MALVGRVKTEHFRGSHHAKCLAFKVLGSGRVVSGISLETTAILRRVQPENQDMQRGLWRIALELTDISIEILKCQNSWSHINL